MLGTTARRRRHWATVQRITARVAAGAVITAGASATLVGLAGVAEAHTGTLNAVAVCLPATGTYTITYSGQTANVPSTVGPATFTVGEVLPAGTTISGAPTTVAGNNTPYSFTQSNVPGTATYAQATAFLAWPNGVKADPIGRVTLPGTCKKTATPVAPSASASTCTANGVVVPGGITIPVTTGVTYTIGGLPVTGFLPKPAGSYTVTPVAQPGYTLTSTAPFTVVVPAGPECLIPAAPVAPSSTQSVCVGGAPTVPTYTIPSTTGIQYLVNGTVKAPGTYPAVAGTTVTVVPQALPGFTLAPGSPGSFPLTFTPAPDCTTHVQAATPTVAQSQCTGLGTSSDATITIPSVTGVSYLVDGLATAAGTYVKTAGTYTVTAVALPGYTLDGIASWPLTVTATPDCTEHVTALPASVTQSECTGLGTSSAAFITIPSSTSVQYAIDAVAVPAGNHVVNAGSYVVTATALPGYTLEGTTSWPLTVNPAPDCTEHVTALPATVTQSACTGLGTSSDAFITIPSSTGVQYAIDGTPVSAGNVVKTAGSYVVTATALPGYTLEGTASWPLTVTAAPDCTEHVTPAAAGVTLAECTGPGTSSAPYITIPSTTGVVYAIDGTTAAAGDHVVSAGQHVVTATAAEGYTLEGQTAWELATGETPDCTVEVGALAVPSVTASRCEGANLVAPTYTIGSTPGVTYLVDGVVTAAGTYATTPESSVTVTAVAQQGYALAEGATASWDLTFAKAAACVLGGKITKPPTRPRVLPTAPTLPTTGTSAGLAALAGLTVLTLGGALTLAGSRRTVVLAG